MSTSNSPDRRAWWGTIGKWLLTLAVVGGVAVFVVPFAWQRWQAESASDDSKPAVPVPHPVKVAIASETPIRAWVFAEGTSRSVRREYLTFEQSGRVIYVQPGEGGEDLRAGDPVQKGQVLAKLDERATQAEIDAAQASLQEAKTQSQTTAADIKQSETDLQLKRTQHNRIEELVRRGAATQSQQEESKAALDNAVAALNAARAKTLATEASIAAAEAKFRQAKVALEERTILSPIDGVVAYLNVEEGYYFTPNIVKTTSESDALQTVPFVVIDPSAYEITIDVPSFEASRVEVGQPVLLFPGGVASEATTAVSLSGAMGTGDGLPAEAPEGTARGTVFSVNPAVNPGGRSIQIKIRTTAGAETLRDGMFVTCWIATKQKPNAVVIPFDALLYAENEPYVFAVLPAKGAKPARAERRAVTLGIQGLDAREVLTGVTAGERVVTTGRYRLTDGAPLTLLDDPVSTTIVGE